MPSPSRLSRLKWRAVLLLSLFAFGCGTSATVPDGQKPVHPARGQLFIGDKPAEGAFVLFVPDDEPAANPAPRPRATVDANGGFQLSTYGENDGAPVGAYSVAVTWPEDGRDSAPDRLKGRYREPGQTKLKAVIKDGPNDLPPFKLK